MRGGAARGAHWREQRAMILHPLLILPHVEIDVATALTRASRRLQKRSQTPRRLPSTWTRERDPEMDTEMKPKKSQTRRMTAKTVHAQKVALFESMKPQWRDLTEK